MKSVSIQPFPDQFLPPLVALNQNSTTWQNEQLIWSSFRLGNRAAFEYICKNNIRFLLEYGSKIIKDGTSVDVCVENLFLDLWRKREIVNDVSNIKLYLLKALRRKMVKALAPSSPRFLGKLDEFDFSSDFASANPFIPLAKKLQIKDGLTQLSNQQREAIFLKLRQQLSYSEIAEVLDLSAQSASLLVGSAIDSLRKYVTFSGPYITK
jgi:RNA polymerase sigma factor (sigma-70 family)